MKLRKPVGAKKQQPAQRKLVRNEKGKRLSLYTRGFENFLQKNPRAIRAFLEARKAGRKFWLKKRMKVEKLQGGRPNERKWLVEFQGRGFFVKETNPAPRPGAPGARKAAPGSGTNKLLALRRLERIKGKKFPGIEIAKGHLGREKGGASFFVGEFYGLPRAPEAKVPRELLLELERFSELARRNGVLDVNKENSFYDGRNNKMTSSCP